MTDTTSLATYTYVRQADGRYLPENFGPPPVTIEYPAEYWSRFAPGSIHEFDLRKGGLGFWQLSEVPLREAYHEYFESRLNYRKKP